METKKKTGKKAAVKPVKKPYLTGSPVDRGSIRGAATFFGGLVVMAVANLLLSSVMMWENTILRVVFNTMMLLVIYAVFFQSGVAKGTTAVGQGEIMYQRKENGKSLNPADQASCYHPAKGYVTGLIGSAPLLICAVILALTAQRQMSGLGALPSWLSVLERREEIGGALTYYHQAVSLNLEDIMRLIIRMSVMPIVNMVGSANVDGLLTMERLSPLAVLLPMLAHGIGYQQGVRVRSQVHTDIAANKRKAARKERKKRQARVRKGPEQLN